LYPVLKWKLDRLLDVYAYKYPKAIETTIKLDSTVQGLKIALQEGNALIDLRTEQRDLKVIESDNLRQALTKTEQAGVLKEKQARKNGRTFGVIMASIFWIAVDVAIVLVLIL